MSGAKVTNLDAVRAARSQRAAAHEALAPMHPALRWVVGEVYWLAHRRSVDGDAACGAQGQLTLAPPGVPLCEECYRGRNRSA